jgi:hypothetical protein
MDPPQLEKNASKRAMGGLGVFQPFPHHHCEIASAGQSGMLAAQGPQTRPFGLLPSLLRADNGTKIRASALLTRLDGAFNLVADGVPWNARRARGKCKSIWKFK